ncbi:DUF3810 domain-containing protein [Pedobacter deserti]|uniref:DUF3810 domain-containing protein n=1 Tax=Pedobacter deserti TaxID=2817382 RepID=UPI0021096D37|nr:DUF3810 domain-containing protein [Pedobacter sp. SYSU D00382]
MYVAASPALRKLLWLMLASIIVYILGYSDITVEVLYSRGLYQLTAILQRTISSMLPFAIGDLLYVSLVIYIIRQLVRFCIRLKSGGVGRPEFKLLFIQTASFLLILYLLFKLLWGLNYSRPQIHKQLGITNDKYTTAQLVQLGSFFIGRLNSLDHVENRRYNINELRDIASAAYRRLENQYPLFRYNQPSVKPVLNSYLITRAGIEGYYNPLSGEANVNMRLPSVSLPFVTCHEIAHQLGIGREDEANLVGYLAAVNSTDDNFRYSAAYAMLKSILFEIRIKSPEDYEKIYQTINPKTIKNLEKDRNFWRQYNSGMFAYMDVAFDRFLKLNNQKKGTDSYQDIVLWLYNIHKKDL